MTYFTTHFENHPHLEMPHNIHPEAVPHLTKNELPPVPKHHEVHPEPPHMAHPEPHPHHAHMPVHHGPKGRHIHRHSLVSVAYDDAKMQAKFGDLWPFHLQCIAAESPENQIKFALRMGFPISVNQIAVQALMDHFAYEAAHDFPNPALTDAVLSELAQRLKVEKEVIKAILKTAPRGEVSVIIAML